MTLSLTTEQQAKLERLDRDFAYFAKALLRIRTKAGEVVPFELNSAQRRLHDRLEDQVKRTGMVRAVVLKGRQMGSSTYIEGRFYWRMWRKSGKGLRAFILTHEQAATDNIFAMAKRFQEKMPDGFAHPTMAANAKELAFSGRDSSYAVATAGTKGVGRSETIQLFHGCLAPDTQIVSGGSLVRMDALAVGDQVRTHTGAEAPISFISRQHKAVREIVLKGSSGCPLAATDEHKFWTRNGWRELGQLTAGDKIGFPVCSIEDVGAEWGFAQPAVTRQQGGGSIERVPNTVKPDYRLGRILGLYLAEGCIKKNRTGTHSGVMFAVHEREVDRTVDWLNDVRELLSSVKVQPRSDSKTVIVTAYGKSFGAFVDAMCGRTEGKRIPADWAKCGAEFARGLVHGYLAGDGHSSKRDYDRRISAPSIRSAITVGMRDILASLGYGWAGINYRPGAVRNGRNEQAQWTLRLSGSGVDTLVDELGWQMPPRRRNGAYGQVAISDGYAWVPIVSIGKPFDSEVMDLEVAHPDHSYCTSHGATHNSEVAFWPNAESHIDGVEQAIADAAGTEKIFESTANGVGNVFQRRYAAAERGESSEEAIFLPWYWDDGYFLEPPADWEPTPQWRDYGRAHKLTYGQVYWAFEKNRSMAVLTGNSLDEPCWKFKQEYPATASEAFQTAGNSFIASERVATARKGQVIPQGPLIIGVDPARGGDKTGVIDRRGRRLGELICERWDFTDTMLIVGGVVRLIKLHNPAAVNIDIGGLGAGVVDRLNELGYGSVVNAVNFGSSPLGVGPTGDELYANRRAEMWDLLRDWFNEPAGVQIPDDDVLHADLTAPVWGSKATRWKSNNELQLEGKDEIRARLGSSPDLGDAAALTFAIPVAPAVWDDEDEELRGRSLVTGY